MSNDNALHARTGQTLKNRLNKLNASGVLPGGGGMTLGWRNHKMFPGRGSMLDDLKGGGRSLTSSLLSQCYWSASQWKENWPRDKR